MMTPTDGELLAERPYYPTVPAGADDGTPRPLVIVLAGFGDVGTDAAAYLGFTALAADQGFFLVAPDPDALHARYAWDPSPTHYPNFDVEYLTAIIHDMEARYTIDRGRVFVAGHSLGAHMAHRMGCDAAADVAAVVSLAGQAPKDPADCVPSQPVSVVEIHGTADEVIGYDGDVQNDPPDPTVPSAHETIAVWARNDGCTGAIADSGARLDLDSSLDGSETTVEAYAGCPAGTGVELWSNRRRASRAAADAGLRAAGLGLSHRARAPVNGFFTGGVSRLRAEPASLPPEPYEVPSGPAAPPAPRDPPLHPRIAAPVVSMPMTAEVPCRSLGGRAAGGVPPGAA